MADCAFPLCTRIAQKNGLCIGHGIYEGEFPVAIIKELIEKPKGIAKVSEKRKVQNRVLAKQVKQIKKDKPVCSIKSPACNGKTVTINHIQKRSPKNLTDPDNQEASCAPCNQYIEDHPAWAKKHGHHKVR